MPGWDTDKFVYARISVNRVEVTNNNDDEIFESPFESSDDYSDFEVNKIIELYGTIYDAYKFYNIINDELIEK